MRLGIQFKDIIYFSVLVLLLVLCAVLVGYRDLSIGTDTRNYAEFFFSVRETYNYSRFEFLYKYITLLFSYLTGSVIIYFSLIYLIFNFFYLAFFLYFNPGERRLEHLFVLFGMMCLSSWYIVATTNGLRQGLSLPLLYFSLLFFSQKRYLRSIFLLFFSIGFHKSVLLVAPFFFLVFFSANSVFLLFLLSAVLYYFGLTEVVLKSVSAIMPVDFHGYIASYGSKADQWVGFQLSFFLYTLFWGWAGFFLRSFVVEHFLWMFSRAWKFYCILMLPYFFFGFGSYPNRYAFIGWLFLPVLQAIFIIGCGLSVRIKIVISLFFTLYGFFSYNAYLLGFWGGGG